MTAVVMIIALLVGSVAQTLLPPCTILGQVKPPVLLAVVIYYALHRSSVVMVCAAFMAGLLQDSLTLIPLGYSSALFIVIGWLIGRYRDFVSTESSVTPIFFGGIAGVIVMLLMSLLMAKDGLIHLSVPRLFLKMLGAGFLCMLSTLVVFLLVGGLERMVGNVRTINEIDGKIKY